MTRSHRLFGRERETVESAFPGDVVGVINPGLFRIGDTVSEAPGIEYPPMPSFQPSEFARLRCVDVARRKQFDRGLVQLEEEGVIRILRSLTGSPDPILAAAGALQFSIVESRLAAEYGVRTEVAQMAHKAARWIAGEAATDRQIAQLPPGTIPCADTAGRQVLLFEGDWEVRYVTERLPELVLEQLA
jgi:peptide chain release factor 3